MNLGKVISDLTKCYISPKLKLVNNETIANSTSSVSKLVNEIKKSTLAVT